jgi:hypothetical protein
VGTEQALLMRRGEQSEGLRVRRDHEHVGLAEIAGLLGVTKVRAHQIATEHDDFPHPATYLRMGGVWHADEVQAWIESHPNRPPGRPRRAVDDEGR